MPKKIKGAIGLLSAELNVWIAAAGRLGVLWSGWVPRFWGK